jgi:hypothetical protein
MRHDIAIRWAEALESGQFTQCKGILKRELDPSRIQHCATGVLVELYEREHGSISHKIGNELNYFVYAFGPQGFTGRLPVEVTDWAEMQDGCVNVNDGRAGGRRPLTWLNDGGSWPFERIAPLIREQWKEL